MISSRLSSEKVNDKYDCGKIKRPFFKNKKWWKCGGTDEMNCSDNQGRTSNRSGLHGWVQFGGVEAIWVLSVYTVQSYMGVGSHICQLWQFLTVWGWMGFTCCSSGIYSWLDGVGRVHYKGCRLAWAVSNRLWRVWFRFLPCSSKWQVWKFLFK